jgi:hypothetical protein
MRPFVTGFRQTVYAAMAAGDLLIEAQHQVKHGQWLPWLEKNCEAISARTAQRYMFLAKRRPEVEANATRMSHLTITEAIRSIAPPPLTTQEKIDEILYLYGLMNRASRLEFMMRLREIYRDDPIAEDWPFDPESAPDDRPMQ